MNILLVILLIFLLLNCINREGYLNYQELSYKGGQPNCPQVHANNLKKIIQTYQMPQSFGYTPNYLFDMTRFIKTDIPLPTNPDFFKTI